MTRLLRRYADAWYVRQLGRLEDENQRLRNQLLAAEARHGWGYLEGRDGVHVVADAFGYRLETGEKE